MPKNTACPGVPRVSDPITGQEMAYVHLILSGTMTDRRAAEAVGLNPDTAAYTKSKPRVRAYMLEHRAAVKEKLVDQEADLSRRAVDGLRKLNIGRDQILARLWELANLSHEVTRGIIAGQIRALSMIVAIEGLIPDRRLSPSGTQPAAPPINAQIYESEWLRKQRQAAGGEPGDAVTAAESQPAAPQIPDPEPASNPTTDAPPPLPDLNFDRNQPSPAHPVIPQPMNRVPLAEDSGFHALLDTLSSPRQPFSIKKGPFTRRR
jgi:hypothetical protein